MNSVFSEMSDKWPSALVARSEVKRFSGGAISGGHLANEDSRGCGPSERILIGKRVCYPVRALVAWLEQRAKALPSKGGQEFGEL